MFEFANPQYLYGLVGCIALLAISLGSYYWRRRQLHRYADRLELRELIMPDRVGRKRLTRDILLIGAFAMLFVVLARPQRPTRESLAEDQRGIEAMLCIDVSNSMLAEDVAPSRISFVRRLVSRLVEQMQGDKLGIVIFAANAYVQLPITTDYASLQSYLSDISPSMLSAQGTDIGEAITLSQTAFSDRRDIGKSIIIFTDAEDLEAGGQEAAQAAAEAGISVHVVGIGTEEGAPIPSTEGYLRDQAGQVVTTHLDVSVGKAIAQAGGGSFVASTSEGQILTTLEDQLSHLPRAALGKVDRAGYLELYAPWVALAILLLVLETFVSQRRNRLWRRYNIFRNDKH